MKIAAREFWKHGNACWLCRCSCGNVVIVKSQRLLRGETKSCGCLKLELLTQRHQEQRQSYKHGHGSQRKKLSPTYISWQSMKRRCAYPNPRGYQNYGGRDITVCARWDESFSAFLMDMGERPEGKTLDRINPDGNYEPTNCRWATASEQRRNHRAMVTPTYN